MPRRAHNSANKYVLASWQKSAKRLYRSALHCHSRKKNHRLQTVYKTWS